MNTRLLFAFIIMLTVSTNANARTALVGDEVTIQKSYKTSSKSSDGSSSGSSSGRDSLVERTIAIREDGRELIFDLPKSATKEDRARSWQFPARVFQSNRGPTTLLNQNELEARLAKWLTSARWDRSACGRWIFTWTAVYIECDPQSVIATINGFDVRVNELREGASYADSEAIAPGTLARKSSDAKVMMFQVEMKGDPDKIRRAQAKSGVIVGEIMRKPVALETALQARQTEDISGSVSVTLELDDGGHVRKRMRVIHLTIKQSDGSTETQINTDTVERL